MALVAEGVELREAGIDAPILVLSEQPHEAAAAIVEYRLTPTVYTRRLRRRPRRRPSPTRLPVHLKIDTGMQRVGAHPAHGRRARRVDRGASARRWSWWACSPISRSPTSPTIRSPPTQLARFDDVLTPRADRSGGARGELGRRVGPPGGAALVRARRDRHVRHLAGTRRRRPRGRSPPGDVAEGADLVREAGRGRAAGSRTAGDTSSPATPPSPRSRSGTPTASRAGCRRRPPAGWTRAHPRPAASDRRHDHDGPVHGRLRRPRRCAAGEEVVLIGEQEGPDGVERITATEWADHSGHDRLRDRVRDQRVACRRTARTSGARNIVGDVAPALVGAR